MFARLSMEMTSVNQATVSLSDITTPAIVENRELQMLIIHCLH